MSDLYDEMFGTGFSRWDAERTDDGVESDDADPFDYDDPFEENE